MVVRFFNRSEKFIAQAQIEGEPRSHFEIVERVDCINLPPIIDIRCHAGDGSAVADALHETGEGFAAGAGGAVIVVDEKAATEVHRATRGGRLKDRELFEAKFGAEL